MLVFLAVGMVNIASALELTAVALFACNGQGELNISHRLNTGPIDGAWDVYLYEGDVFNPATDNPAGIKWLNNKNNHTINIPLKTGINKFTFHNDGADVWPITGMNFFFNGNNNEAAISVLAKTDMDGPPYPGFSANSAGTTMGWPLTGIPGAGTLSYGGTEIGLWEYKDSKAGLKVTLKEFHLSAPGVNGKLDIVGPHDFEPSGKPDFVGQFTLEVEQYVPEPPALMLWLQTMTGITLGGPDNSDKWRELFDYKAAQPPFSFSYGGKASSKFLKNWRIKTRQKNWIKIVPVIRLFIAIPKPDCR